MIKKLDIKYSMNDNTNSTIPKENTDDEDHEEEVLESANLQRLVPAKPKDFEIFFNLVDFTQNILQYHQSNFKEWVYIYARDLIQMSNKYPLISGFYKLLTVAMNICEKIDYFEEINVETSKRTSNNDKNKDILVCFKIFDKFRKEVEFRVHQYKNELLAACIKFVLSVPKQFIQTSLPISAIQMALKMGLSFIDLAHIGLNALESWLRSKPEITKKFLPDILPLFNDYLTLDSEEYEKKVTSRFEKDFQFKQGKNITKKSKASVLEKVINHIVNFLFWLVFTFLRFIRVIL